MTREGGESPASGPAAPASAGPTTLVVVGASLGGLAALAQLLGPLPATFAAPVLVTQHRSPDERPGLASILARRLALPVSEGEDRQVIRPGHVILAPPDYHLLVDGPRIGLTLDAPVHFSRPSIDVLFRSAADSRGRAVIGVLLTAATVDGAEGLWWIRQVGGRTLVQDPDQAEADAAPRAALALEPRHEVMPVERMACRLLELVEAGARSPTAGS